MSFVWPRCDSRSVDWSVAAVVRMCQMPLQKLIDGNYPNKNCTLASPVMLIVACRSEMSSVGHFPVIKQLWYDLVVGLRRGNFADMPAKVA